MGEVAATLFSGLVVIEGQGLELAAVDAATFVPKVDRMTTGRSDPLRSVRVGHGTRGMCPWRRFYGCRSRGLVVGSL